MDEPALCLNGIDGATGSYLLPSLTVAQIAWVASGEPPREFVDDALRARHQASLPSFGVRYDIDSQDLSQTGWGIIYPHDATPEVADGLRPLLTLRRDQAGDLYKEFSGTNGYRPGEKARDWLARQGAGPGQVQENKVPYYLLVVGDPERIPYRFQFDLGINYGVGRISFDRAQDYATYAKSVVAAERRQRLPSKSACFFGVRNQGDRATQMSADSLIAPLAGTLAKQRSAPDWTMESVIGDQATKAELSDRLNGATRCELLVTASHGMSFPAGHALQRLDQGALLCQDWPGPLRHRGAIPKEFYFSGEDISEDADLSGTILFAFACYGAGVPQFDDFAHSGTRREAIAPSPFLARLPQRMLSAPGGGALAVVGHVERAWSYSFKWPGLGDQTNTFENCLGALLDGRRVGSAMEPFAQRHADLAVTLGHDLEDIKFGAIPNSVQLAGLWTAKNDARNFVVVGDPAVRINP